MSKDKWVPKVGDRIIFFGNTQTGSFETVPDKGIKAKIVTIYDGGDWFRVWTQELNNGERSFTVHRKQCRRLVRRHRHRFWVHKSYFTDWPMAYGPTMKDMAVWNGNQGNEYLEFLEVRRKWPR